MFGRSPRNYISDVEAEVVSYLTCRMHVVKTVVFEVGILAKPGCIHLGSDRFKSGSPIS